MTAFEMVDIIIIVTITDRRFMGSVGMVNELVRLLDWILSRTEVSICCECVIDLASISLVGNTVPILILSCRPRGEGQLRQKGSAFMSHVL